MTAAAILAGGRASRLGGLAKALLPLGSGRIIDRQLAVLRQVVDEVFVVAGEAAPYEPLGVRVVPDAVADVGALGGLVTALEASPAPEVLVLACDLPFVTAAFARYLRTQGRGYDVAVPKTADGYHPLCAIWSRHALPEIAQRAADGRRRILDALPALRVREIGPDEVARFDRPAGTLLFNVNTPHDYERALLLDKSYHDHVDHS